MTAPRPSGASRVVPARREISLRYALTLSIGAIVLFLAVSLMVLALLERRQARTDLSRAVLERALARTNGDLSELFAPVRRQLAIDWHEVRMGEVPRYDAAAHARYFLPAMRELPMVGSMMVGDTAGHQLLLMRYDSTVLHSPLLEGRTDLPVPARGTTQFFTRDVRPAVRGEMSTWQLWNDAATAATATWRVRIPGYDPREREWYRQAIRQFQRRGAAESGALDAAPSIAWSDVYTFFTTREPGLSASFATRQPSGALMVVSYDVLLDQVSQYTRTQAPTRNGSLILVSDSGWMIGLPREARFDLPAERAAVAMLPVERLGNPVFSAWATAWRSRGDDTTRIQPVTVAGARWWAGFRTFELERGRRFWIGVMVPEADVVATMGSQGTSILLASALATEDRMRKRPGPSGRCRSPQAQSLGPRRGRASLGRSLR